MPRSKRACVLITIQKSFYVLSGGESSYDYESHLHTPKLSLDCCIFLPLSLPIPHFDTRDENNGGSELHISQLAEGKLGALLFSSAQLVFFESFVPIRDSGSLKFTGIEVLNVATSEGGESFSVSVLLSYPDLNVS